MKLKNKINNRLGACMIIMDDKVTNIVAAMSGTGQRRSWGIPFRFEEEVNRFCGVRCDISSFVDDDVRKGLVQEKDF